MIVNLTTQGLQTLDQIRDFIDHSAPLGFEPPDRSAVYEWLAQELRRFGYARLGKADKGLLKRYLARVTGLSRAQITRLIAQFVNAGRITDRRGAPAQPFPRRYTDADVRALAEMDALHGTLSGPATRKLCERAWTVFHDPRYERLASISNGHLYNLRHSTGYQRRRGQVTKTSPSRVQIGLRRPPRPDGQPGYLRVDSVHQGDQDGIKGLYHINLVDEVTQFQFVGTVERITERFLLPVLEGLMGEFPFTIRAFHADNGSEYINHRVAQLLDKLHINEFTKSRARRTNDNALVESKNGSVVRKQLGYAHIPQRFAAIVHQFNQTVLSPYLNFHRPCLFPIEHLDARGKATKRYPYDQVMTPYEKLKSLPNAEAHLKPGLSFKTLDDIAYAISDNEAAERLTKARGKLFQTIYKSQKPAA